MDDLLNKAKEVAGEVGEKGKDIFEGLAREGKEVVDKVKDLFDGDEVKPVDLEEKIEGEKPEQPSRPN